MELSLPYLEAINFRKSLGKNYRFLEQGLLNSTFMKVPDDLGKGALMLFDKGNFHFFRGKWDFAEETFFHSKDKVGHNGLLDFRINNDAEIGSNLIYGKTGFEQNITHIDGLRIFIPKEAVGNDTSFLRERLESSGRDAVLRDRLSSLFSIDFENPANSLLVESSIIAFLSSLITYLQSDQPSPDRSGRLTEKIILAKKFIDQNAFRHISIDELSRYCGLNTCDLKRGFRDYAQTPVRQYIIKTRMDAAHQLILEGRKSIGEISEMVGYTNRGHFAQLYLRCFGRLPSEENNFNLSG